MCRTALARRQPCQSTTGCSFRSRRAPLCTSSRRRAPQRRSALVTAASSPRSAPQCTPAPCLAARALFRCATFTRLPKCTGATVPACTMFGREGIVQVRHRVYWCFVIISFRCKVTECATVYACAVFGREGIVQVCHLYPVAKVYWCHSARLRHVWPRGHRSGAPHSLLTPLVFDKPLPHSVWP